MAQGINKKVWILATVEPESHFVEVRGQMLRAHIMPSTHDAALQKGERGFDGIRMHQTVDVFLAVIDGLVGLPLLCVESERIDSGFVRHNHVNVFAQVFADDLAHALGIRVFRMDESQFTVALADSENYFLVLAREPAASLPA